MEQDFDTKHWTQPCPKYDCRKAACKCGLKYVYFPVSLGDDSSESPIAPKNGEYCDAIVAYEANGHVYIYSKEGVPTLVTPDGGASEEEIARIERKLATETTNRVNGDNALQREIDDIKNSPDVVDIVATYEALQDYDTSKLGDNDIVRVLQDEEHDGQSTYYRWDAQDSSWTYIGAVGDYYTKGQVDILLSDKQDELTAGENISIGEDDDALVISAVDTTYNNFVGTDGSANGTAGLVPAPVIADAGKYLKADGTWSAVSSGPSVVQKTGTSTTDVMSQDATTSMVYADTSKTRVAIGNNSSAWYAATAIGSNATANYGGSVALGSYSSTSAVGEVNVGSSDSTRGYSSSNYRLISGVYDGQNAHDAATKGQLDAISNYSTSEVDTGATWIDGKKIYKKTIDFGALPNNTNKQVAHDISNLDKVIKVEQHLNNGPTYLKGFLLLSSGPSNVTDFNLYGTDTAISVSTNSDRSSVYAYFTLYYTKSS